VMLGLMLTRYCLYVLAYCLSRMLHRTGGCCRGGLVALRGFPCRSACADCVNVMLVQWGDSPSFYLLQVHYPVHLAPVARVQCARPPGHGPQLGHPLRIRVRIIPSCTSSTTFIATFICRSPRRQRSA
jgi:hypothetical protein